MADETIFKLSSAIKTYTKDQDKVVSPGETVEKALSRLKKMFDLSHVKIERRYDAVSGAFSFSSISDQLNCSGKGMSEEQAKASAIMEFAERYSWTHFDYAQYDGYKMATYGEIKKGDTQTVDENYFLCNYFELENKEAFIDEIKQIPLRWIKGDSLTNHNKFYYPINWHNISFSSNGLAAGNSLEEAIIQALCELIERENIYKFIMEKREGNDLDQRSIKSPITNQLLENAGKAGVTFVIKEISFDFKVPTFIACGTSEGDKGRLAYQGVGQGTATDPEKALMRALSEYFEGYSLIKKTELQAKEEAAMDIMKYMEYLPKKHYGFHVLRNPEMLNKGGRTIKMSDIKNISHDDIKDEIEYIVKILKKYNYNVVMINKTHPSLRIPAVRLFAPGMRSPINCEFIDPSNVLMEVNLEAGRDEDAKHYFESYMRDLVKLPQIYAQIKGKVQLDKVFERDYLKNLVKLHKDRKTIIASLKDAEMVADSLRFILNK